MLQLCTAGHHWHNQFCIDRPVGSRVLGKLLVTFGGLHAGDSDGSCSLIASLPSTLRTKPMPVMVVPPCTVMCHVQVWPAGVQ